MGKKKTRQWQTQARIKAQANIIRALADGKPHLYGDLVKETNLSKATLSKHLKIMDKKGQVAREMDTTKKYPYPVSYALTEKDKDFAELHEAIMNILKKADADLKKTKDPSGYFHIMNALSNTMLLNMVKTVKEWERDEEMSSQEFQEMVSLIMDIGFTYPMELFAQQFLGRVQRLGINPKDFEHLGNPPPLDCGLG